MIHKISIFYEIEVTFKIISDGNECVVVYHYFFNVPLKIGGLLYLQVQTINILTHITCKKG